MITTLYAIFVSGVSMIDHATRVQIESFMIRSLPLILFLILFLVLLVLKFFSKKLLTPEFSLSIFQSRKGGIDVGRNKPLNK